MNKKIVATMLGITVGGAALITSAYAVMADSSGYDMYKSALKQTKAATSMSVDAGISLSDNGKKLLTVDSKMKEEEKNRSASGIATIEANGKSFTVNLYREGQKTIVKTSDSDVFNVMERDQKKHRFNQNEHTTNSNQNDHQQMAENILDALMVNLKNDIKTNSNADGTKDVTLQLSENDISPVVQSLGAVFVQNAAKHGDDQQQHANKIATPFKQNIKASIPALTQDIKIKNVDITAKIGKDNYLQQQKALLTITGKDASGTEHEVVLGINVNLSHFNDTKADHIDLTGKKVQTVKDEHKAE